MKTQPSRRAALVTLGQLTLLTACGGTGGGGGSGSTSGGSGASSSASGASSSAAASSSSSSVTSSSSSSSVGSDFMPTERRTVWNPGLNAVGGIPARNTIYQTLSPSGGDDTAAIQAALNACPAGQVVRLAAGTFKISGMGLEIARSNVTLRGAGSSATKLVQADNASYPVIIVGTRWVKHTESRPLTANGAKGSYSITVSSAASLKIGEIITLNQVSDDTRSDTVAPVRKVYWGKNTLSPTDDTRRWFCELNRPIGQTLEITAISGNQLTFNTPLHIDFETALSAHICRFSTQDPDSKGWSALWASQVERHAQQRHRRRRRREWRWW
ncbi:MAG: glycosyl hydrolase family 28-related protein [Rhodocyclaceae bacterium]